jgi:hypothetical protein
MRSGGVPGSVKRQLATLEICAEGGSRIGGGCGWSVPDLDGLEAEQSLGRADGD